MDFTSMALSFAHIENMIEEQREMEEYIGECVILSSTPKKRLFSEMVAFNEASVSDKIKAVFTRIKSFFSKIWQKFLEKLNAAFSNEKEYLEKYKDIIIGKKVTLSSVKMANHFKGIERVRAAINKAPTFAVPIDFNGVVSSASKDGIIDFSSQSGSMGIIKKKATDVAKGADLSEAREKYLVEQYNSLVKICASDSDIKIDESSEASTKLNEYFNGGEDETFGADDLDMKVMYKYVYSVKELTDGLNKMRENYMASMTKNEQAYVASFEKYKKLVDANKTAQKSNDNKAKTTAQSNIDAANSDLQNKLKEANKAVEDSGEQKKQEESYVYSKVLGRIINEDGVVINAGDSPDSSGNKTSTVKPGGNAVSNKGATDAAKAVHTTMNNTNTAVKNNMDGSKTSASTVGTADAKDVSENGIAEKMAEYQSAAQSFISAYGTARNVMFGSILNGANSARKDFMQIIRAHVNVYLGTVNNTEQDTGATSI